MVEVGEVGRETGVVHLTARGSEVIGHRDIYCLHVLIPGHFLHVHDLLVFSLH